jgi:CrcB protein
LEKLLLLAVGGAAGTISRYGLSGLAHRLLGESFPFGTFFVNILGCFLFGLVAGFFEIRGGTGSQARILLLIGFMGAFTTFSTYIFESVGMARLGEWLPLAANLAGQVVVGFIVMILGMATVRALFGA